MPTVNIPIPVDQLLDGDGFISRECPNPPAFVSFEFTSKATRTKRPIAVHTVLKRPVRTPGGRKRNSGFKSS